MRCRCPKRIATGKIVTIDVIMLYPSRSGIRARSMYLVWCGMFGVLAFTASLATAQLSDPLPAMDDSEIEVALEEWLTIPASSGSFPMARINHVKPCPDGIRLFCNDLRGKLWVIASTQATSATEFLDLTDQFSRFVDSPGLGTGFTSFAFHPEFATVGTTGYGRFYTAHVEDPVGSPVPDLSGPLSPGVDQHGVITEWAMSDTGDNALVSVPTNFSRREVLRIAYPWIIHGLQEIAFDPGARPGDDNYGCLFICAGDGGSVNLEVPGNTGRLDSPLGTILRIVPVLATGHAPTGFAASANGAYYIPASNPYVGAADPTPGDGFDIVEEIFAYGFRNPHRISWDQTGGGTMTCGNIGQDNVEEVEMVVSGGHYGWPFREGSFLFDASDPASVYPLPVPDTGPAAPSLFPNYFYPVAQFGHDDGVAIVGGFVYRGKNIPELYGKYVCGGIARGELYLARAADFALQAPAASGDAPAEMEQVGVRSGGAPSSLRTILGRNRADLRFGIDHDGELLVLSKQNGGIYRVKSIGHQFVGGLAVTTEEGGRTISFPTSNGMNYRLWTSGDLRNWELREDTVSGTGGIGQFDGGGLQGRGFFQVSEVAP